MTGNWGLVDLDTPRDVYTKNDYVNGKSWQLVFSDEFNRDGRTFYPGDDPYWEAVDLHYWQTNNSAMRPQKRMTTQPTLTTPRWVKIVPPWSYLWSRLGSGLWISSSSSV